LSNWHLVLFFCDYMEQSDSRSRAHFLSDSTSSHDNIGAQNQNGYLYEQQQQQNMTDLGFQLGAVLESLFDNVDRSVNRSSSPVAPVMCQESSSELNAETVGAMLSNSFGLSSAAFGDTADEPDAESETDADAQAEVNAQIAAQQASGKSVTKRSNIPCVYFGVPGKKCYSGSKCQFLHEDQDLSSRPCAYFGIPGKKCFAGDKCSFLHVAPNAVVGKTASDSSARTASSADGDDEAGQRDVELDPMFTNANGIEVISTAAKPGQKKICYPFNSKRGCLRGANCIYLHVPFAATKSDDGVPTSSPTHRMFRYCDYVSPAGTACKLECADGSTSCRMHAHKHGSVSSVMGSAAAAGAGAVAVVDKKGKADKATKNKWCTYVSVTGVKCRLSCAEDHASLCKMHAHQAVEKLRDQDAAKLKTTNKTAGKKGANAASPSAAAAVLKSVDAQSLRQMVGQTLLGMLVNEQDAGCRLAFGKLLKLLNENTPWVLSTIDQAAGTPDINIHQLINALLTMVNVMSIA
jgi:hypothetical protein